MKKSKSILKEQALREKLKFKPYFNERDFQILLTAFNNRERVLAIKQARAIMGVCLKVAIDWVDANWNCYK